MLPWGKDHYGVGLEYHKLNPQLLQINRNFIICSIISISLSAVVAQTLGDQENYVNTTVTIIAGYAVYFGIFSILFYRDNKGRYKTMKTGLIKKEILKMISSFGAGEAVYLGVRWPTLYYFLDAGMEPYLASLISEVISTGCYMLSVTLFLKRARTF